jgi:hypothetical protein
MNTLLVFGGLIIAGAAGIWLLIMMFTESVLLGLCALLLWPVQLFYVATHWDEAKVPFLAQLFGVALMFMGGAFASS